MNKTTEETTSLFTKTPMPGVYADVPAEEYHKWDAMSNSWLGVIATESPLVFEYQRRHPRLPTGAMAQGSCLHKLILEPFDFADAFAVAPDCNRRTKQGKDDWAEFQALAAGKTVIEQKEYRKLAAMAHAVMAHADAALFFVGGRPELSIVWDDELTGIRCKARLDYYNTPVIPDLKSTRDVREHKFRMSIYDYGYHRQAAMYLDGTRAVGLDAEAFVFVAVNKTAPHDVAPWVADGEILSIGQHEYRAALRDYAECLKTGEWPGVCPKTSKIGLPSWVRYKYGMGEQL